MQHKHYFLKTCLFIGFAFFYIPILSMIFFSFNKSRLATVWGGFSTEWYWKLFANRQVMGAALLSLEIALVSATIATILGTMAGIALARFKRFRGRTVFSGFVTAPLIMPEVITGISMLMFFILLAQVVSGVGQLFGIPPLWTNWITKRGFTTVTIAHITFSLTFVTTIVQSRLSSMDISIEEAAMDLGSRPWQVLKDVTLPIILPAIMSGWLLAFTISLDDVVITNFTTGPGATTLPILIWSKVKLGVTPDINALASIVIVIVGICVGIAGIIMMQAERRRERDIHMAAAANE